MTTAVQVVELRLGDRVVHVDRREQQLALVEHRVETVHPGGGLLGDALDRGRHASPLRRVGLQRALEQTEDDREFGVAGLGRVGHLAGLLVLDTLVHEQRGVATVVEDHVGAFFAVHGRVPAHHLLGAPPVLLERLALPGEHRHARRLVDRAVRTDHDSRRGVVLGGEDVARRPTHFGAELDQRLDEHRGLDGHVQRPRDPGAGEWLGRPVLLADRHQAGHLVLGEDHLLATERGEGEVGDAEILPSSDRGRHDRASRQMRVGLGVATGARAPSQRASRDLLAPIGSAHTAGARYRTVAATSTERFGSAERRRRRSDGRVGLVRSVVEDDGGDVEEVVQVSVAVVEAHLVGVGPARRRTSGRRGWARPHPRRC